MGQNSFCRILILVDFARTKQAVTVWVSGKLLHADVIQFLGTTLHLKPRFRSGFRIFPTPLIS